MLQVLWQARLSGGVIDCDFNTTNRTVLTGDSSGNVTLFDINGANIMSKGLGSPVWGVSHSYDDAGALRIAAAQGRKDPDSGRGTLLVDFEAVRQIERARPIWDARLDQAGTHAYFTSWDGTVMRVAFDTKESEHECSLPGPCYGLALEPGGHVLAAVAGRGVFRLSSDLAHAGRYRDVPDCCYNIVHDERRNWLATGSNESAALLLKAQGQQRLPMPGRQVSAVAIAESVVIAGDLDGNIGLFWPSKSLLEPFSRIRFDGGVWDLEYIANERLLFVSCGDGHLFCCSVGEAEINSDAVEHLLSLGRDDMRIADFNSAARGIPKEIAVMQLWKHWDLLERERPAELEDWLREITAAGGSDRALYMLGMLLHDQQRYAEAIPVFQRIDSLSEEYVRALLPLARCLRNEGAAGSAVRLLRANIERVAKDSLLEFLFEIGTLYELRRDVTSAIEFFEFAASIDWNYRDVGKRLATLRELPAIANVRQPPEVAPIVRRSDEWLRSAPVMALGKSRRDDYDVVSYIKYEHAPAADEAKKVLEFDLMEWVLNDSQVIGGSSLDVGCATGRWPLWFSSRGFAAVGIDISPAAIELCRKRAQQMGNETVRFELLNLLDTEDPIGSFSVITCMMGTFNHIKRDDARTFVERLYLNLGPGGTLVLSVWNPRSPFTDFLYLDSDSAKDSLRDNAMQQDALLELFTDRERWEAPRLEPFCCLPNTVYNAWEDSFAGVDELVELDRQLRRSVGGAKAQMFFLVVRRRAAV